MKTSGDVELSIVMPCLNEAGTLATCIKKAQTYLSRAGVNGEIVIGDNGSTDGSTEIASSLGVRVVHTPLRGYGAALHNVLTSSSGRYCILGDSDCSYDFERLDLFLERLRDGYDVVIGNRFLGGIEAGAMPWKNRYVGNPVLSSIGRILFCVKVKDFHCGLRGVSRQAFQRMNLRTTGMEFASEMVIKATLLNLKVTEVPTTLHPDGRSRSPHLRPYRDAWRHLRFMLLCSPNWLFLYPGLMLMMVGLTVGVVLLSHPFYLNSVRIELDVLVYCGSFVLAGFQAILVFLIARTFATREGLYPETPGFVRFARYFSLERGLLLGATLLLVGLLTGGHAVLEWRDRSLGDLVIEHLARIVIPSSLAISIGIELIVFSLLIGTFALSRNGSLGDQPCQ